MDGGATRTVPAGSTLTNTNNEDRQGLPGLRDGDARARRHPRQPRAPARLPGQPRSVRDPGRRRGRRPGEHCHRHPRGRGLRHRRGLPDRVRVDRVPLKNRTGGKITVVSGSKLLLTGPGRLADPVDLRGHHQHQRPVHRGHDHHHQGHRPGGQRRLRSCSRARRPCSAAPSCSWTRPPTAPRRLDRGRPGHCPEADRGGEHRRHLPVAQRHRRRPPHDRQGRHGRGCFRHEHPALPRDQRARGGCGHHLRRAGGDQRDHGHAQAECPRLGRLPRWSSPAWVRASSEAARPSRARS